MLDQYKDLGYLFYIPHTKFSTFVLSFSISTPLALFHLFNIVINTFSITHSVLVHYHLSNNKFEDDNPFIEDPEQVATRHIHLHKAHSPYLIRHGYVYKVWKILNL